MRTYKALKDCVIGGVYRKAGDVFEAVFVEEPSFVRPHFPEAAEPPRRKGKGKAARDRREGGGPDAEDEAPDPGGDPGVDAGGLYEARTLDDGLEGIGHETMALFTEDPPVQIDRKVRMNPRHHKLLRGK
jgi:hypothetical protein